MWCFRSPHETVCPQTRSTPRRLGRGVDSLCEFGRTSASKSWPILIDRLWVCSGTAGRSRTMAWTIYSKAPTRLHMYVRVCARLQASFWRCAWVGWRRFYWFSFDVGFLYFVPVQLTTLSSEAVSRVRHYGIQDRVGLPVRNDFACIFLVNVLFIRLRRGCEA